MQNNKMDRPFLIGDRIYLRPLDIDDVDGPYLHWVNNEEIISSLESLYLPTSRQQLVDYLSSVINNKDIVFLAIIETQTNKHVGNIKLGPIDWIKRKAIYGRMIGDKESWGKGYGTEAARLIIKYGFERLNLHKIGAMALIVNKGSIKSNQKAGLKIECTIPEEVFRNGKWIDCVSLSITENEYFNSVKPTLKNSTK
tara:strand:- start:30327 stop:30917 length:591 start_codon:yes stop_codon:yes gene_type:complete